MGKILESGHFPDGPAWYIVEESNTDSTQIGFVLCNRRFSGSSPDNAARNELFQRVSQILPNQRGTRSSGAINPDKSESGLVSNGNGLLYRWIQFKYVHHRR